MSTLEDKIEKRKLRSDLKKAFPKYGETKVVHEGEPKLLCKLLGHKRMLHHAFLTEETSRGKEYFECYVCVRCKNILGKLVNIV